jgi:hypothetical protein
MSVDGYAGGRDRSLENPLEVGGTALHEWAFATRSARAMHDMAIVPIVLGRGERLFDGLDGLPGYECVEYRVSPAVAHVRLARTLHGAPT